MEKVIDYNLSLEDYCDGTTLHVAPTYTGCVEISSTSDLTPITAIGYYQPGAVAHTAGWGTAKQLDVDGSTWADM